MFQNCFHSTWWGKCCPVYVRCPPLMPLALTLNPRWRHQSNRHSVAGSHSPFLFTLPSSILLLHATVIMPSIRVSPPKFTSTCLPLGAGARLGRLGSAPPIRAPCTQQWWAHARTRCCVHLCALPASVNWAQCQWLSCVGRQWISAATPCCLHLCSLTGTIKTQLWDGNSANWVSIVERHKGNTYTVNLWLGEKYEERDDRSVKGFVLDYSESNDHEHQDDLISLNDVHNMKASVEWPAQKVVNMPRHNYYAVDLDRFCSCTVRWSWSNWFHSSEANFHGCPL